MNTGFYIILLEQIKCYHNFGRRYLGRYLFSLHVGTVSVSESANIKTSCESDVCKSQSQFNTP